MAAAPLAMVSLPRPIHFPFHGQDAEGNFKGFPDSPGRASAVTRKFFILLSRSSPFIILLRSLAALCFSLCLSFLSLILIVCLFLSLCRSICAIRFIFVTSSSLPFPPSPSFSLSSFHPHPPPLLSPFLSALISTASPNTPSEIR